MSVSRDTEAQIIGALKQLEAGRKAEDVAREVGMSKHTIYPWKAKYGGMDVSQEREAKQLRTKGFTLLELIVAATIMAILTMMALPLAQLTIKREKEKRLRHALWEMRDAIDRYKEAGDRGQFQIKADSYGYPPDLDTLTDARG